MTLTNDAAVCEDDGAACLGSHAAQWGKAHPNWVAVKLILLKAGAPVTQFVRQVAARFRNMDALFDAEFMVRPNSTAPPRA
jgi:hypothetical protein